MAIIKLGALVSGIRGTIGGTTYSANGAGPYVRLWQLPTQPRTPDQVEARRMLGNIASRWRDLTQDQRDDWDTYAASANQELTNSLGETYYASGFAWHCRINTHLELMAEDYDGDAPPDTPQPTPTIDSFAAASGPSGLVRVYFDASEFPNANYRLWIYSAVVSSPGRRTTTNYLLTKIDKPALYGQTYTNIGSEIRALYGELIAGQIAFVRCYRCYIDGRMSRQPVHLLTEVT